MPACFIQNPPDNRKSVASAVESHLRLVSAFRRQRSHAFVIDVGRIGDDQIVTLAVDRREQIAAQQPNALLQTMVRDISAARPQAHPWKARPHRPSPWESEVRPGSRDIPSRCKDRARDETALVVANQRKTLAGKQFAVENFAEIRARHDRPLVDIERHAAHIDALEQIGRGLAGADTPRRPARRFSCVALPSRSCRRGHRHDRDGCPASRRPGRRPPQPDRWCRGRR